MYIFIQTASGPCAAGFHRYLRNNAAAATYSTVFDAFSHDD